MKYCLKCGKQLADHDVFCVGCGAKQPGAQAIPAAAPVQPVQDAWQAQPAVTPTQPAATPTQPAATPVTPVQPAAEKKKGGVPIWLLILLFVLILAIAGVLVYFLFFGDGKSAEKENTNTEEGTSKKDKKKKPAGEGGSTDGEKKPGQSGGDDADGTDENALTYQDIVQLYHDAADLDPNELWQNDNAYLNEEIMHFILYSGGELVYVTYDANGDSVQELFIAQRFNDGEISLVDAYTTIGGNAVELFPRYSFGGRTQLYIMKTGGVYVTGSSSASDSLLEVHDDWEDGIPNRKVMECCGDEMDGYTLLDYTVWGKHYDMYMADTLDLTTLNWSRLVKVTVADEVSGVRDEDTTEADYVLPFSSERLLTEEDLYGLSAEKCRIARNEIYARHGRKFKDEELQAYFDSKSWYYGYIEPGDFTDSMLSDIENKNKDFITKYEREQGYR